MRIRAIMSAAGAVLVAGGLAAVPLSGVHADTWESGVTLPLTSYYQMAVDNRHDQLFFSEGSNADFYNGGSSGDTILVTDFSGKTVDTITGEAGVMGITLSPDDSTLYAALSGAHEVVAISTATLQQTAVYPLGTATPYTVAVQSGKLWVSYYTDPWDRTGVIGDFDLSAASPVLETQAAMGGWGPAPMIAADPTDTGNVLVAIDPYISPPNAASYDTAADPVTVRAARPTLTWGDASNGCTGATDLTVLPGGAQFAPTCDNYNSAVGLYSTATLNYQGSYDSGLYPGSIAFASGTGVVAVGDQAQDNYIYTYTPGGDNTLGLRVTPGSGAIAQRGLALTPDASKLFAVTDAGGSYTLYVMDEPAIVPSAVTLTAPASSLPGNFARLSGAVSADGGDTVADATVTLTRTGPGGTETLTTDTNAAGMFVIFDAPTLSGTYTYTARWAGSPNIAPAAATTHLTVKKVPPLSISVTPKSANYRPTVHITVHLGTTDSDRSVTVYAKPAGATKLTLLKAGTVNSAGNLSLTYSAPHNTTFYARFTGDASYAPRTATAGASVAAAVSTKISGYYASKRIGSVTYRLYHRAKRLLAAVQVAPNKHGECVKMDVQELYKGKWHDSLTACGTLGKNSTVGGTFTLSKADLGNHYRIRAEYQRGKDTTNLSADSGWQYFIVEK